MKCFKIFFKHTWQPQQMESASRCGGAPRACDARSVNETELGELKASPEAEPRPPGNQQPQQGVACRDGACGNGLRRPLPQHRLESPWHQLKTLFLVAIIVALVVWIIVYVLLAQYSVL